MLRYDEGQLLTRLSRVPIGSRAAFAGACAERLFPGYVAFSRRTGWGSQAALAAILDGIWNHVTGHPMDTGSIRAELARCMALVPGEEDEPWVAEQPFADDAASATAYALRVLINGEPQEAAWAARRAYETYDYYVVHCVRVEDGEQATKHPIVQTELARQRRDLGELQACGLDLSNIIPCIRDRARAEAAAFWNAALCS